MKNLTSISKLWSRVFYSFTPQIWIFLLLGSLCGSIFLSYNYALVSRENAELHEEIHDARLTSHILLNELNEYINMASLLEDEVDSLATELEIVKSEEKRIEALRATASRVAPLNEADTRELITITAVEYDVDPILAIAISRLETGNWKSGLCTSQYNYGGMVGSGPHGFAAYSTPAEGINAFCKLLAWYKQNGMDTAQKMASTYCPGNADGWTAKVMELYTQEK